MSLRSITTETSEYCPPRIRLPDSPKVIKIEGIEAFEYITEEKLSRIIDEFSGKHNLSKYEVLLRNREGGVFFTNELIKRQGFRGEVYDIEYHENGTITLPVPWHLKEKCVACIDDVLDLYKTGSMIQNDAPFADLLYLTRKCDVITVASPKNCYWACEVDNRWLLGGGMNGELEGDGLPKNWGRTHRGIAVKILK